MPKKPVVLAMGIGRLHNRPRRITGDLPSVPFLSMTRIEIARRLVAKACLAEASRAAGVRWWDSPTPPDSHGEFGTVEEWRDTDDRRRAVQEWLSTAPEVAAIVDAILTGTQVLLACRTFAMMASISVMGISAVPASAALSRARSRATLALAPRMARSSLSKDSGRTAETMAVAVHGVKLSLLSKLSMFEG
jgi:hypothetical protein